jgi:hypothetical protein
MCCRPANHKTTLPCHLVEADRQAWDACWGRVRSSPLYQSWEYGEAKRRSQRFRPERFVIRRLADQAPVGLVQALVYALPWLGGVARICRGPVFLEDSAGPASTPADLEAAFRALQATATQRRWRLVRIAPELPAGAETAARLGTLGFKRRLENVAIASAVLDLGRPPQEIQAGFNTRWRRHLKKTEKMGLTLEVPPPEEALAFLIPAYETVQRDKGFRGMPAELLRHMAAQEGPAWTCRILFARHREERCGGVMIVGHGDTCTYLVGWTSPEGRRRQANSFLLWQAMLQFRDLGYRFFDVGGLRGRTTKGVEEFKRGLRGQEYSLVGEYSYSPWPFLK